MESKEVTNFIGKRVLYGTVIVTIITYNKGWVHVEFDDGDVEKVRSKSLELLPEPVAPKEDSGKKPVPSTDSSGISLEVRCKHCNSDFIANKRGGVQCPVCYRWNNVHLNPNRDRYIRGMGETASHRSTYDIDDYAATLLRGLSGDELYSTACNELAVYGDSRFSHKMMGEWKKSALLCTDFLVSRYGKLNPGMVRMNLANLIRGAVSRFANDSKEE